MIPKPLVEIGSTPILWHVMKLYSYYGFNEFILCLGYKGNLIKEYFLECNSWRNRDFTLQLTEDGTGEISLHNSEREDWNITFVDTGEDTNTGGRIKKIEPLIDDERFMVTYSDGVADVDIKELAAFHESTGKIGTLTVLQPLSQFGMLEIDDTNTVTSFKEKPRLQTWINGGFFVFNREFFDYLQDNSILEKEPLENLAKDRQLAAYKHTGYWECMDTYKDTITLNELWQNGNSPWNIWQEAESDQRERVLLYARD